jgi:hypothetical protein
MFGRGDDGRNAARNRADPFKLDACKILRRLRAPIFKRIVRVARRSRRRTGVFRRRAARTFIASRVLPVRSVVAVLVGPPALFDVLIFFNRLSRPAALITHLTNASAH